MSSRRSPRCGYFPNTIARSLRSDQSKTIGLIIPLLDRSRVAEIASDFQSLCHDQGYLVVLCASERDVASEERAIGLLRNHQVDGVVILPTQDLPALLRPLLFAGVPTVVIDRYLPNAHSITVDDWPVAGLVLSTCSGSATGGSACCSRMSSGRLAPSACLAIARRWRAARSPR